MGLESTSVITGLVTTNPVGASDSPSSLDDHIRLIKTVLSTDAMGASTVNAATSKATPVDADLIPLVDSAASYVNKKLTWANLKATLKTYTDTLYSTISLAVANTWTASQRGTVTTDNDGSFDMSVTNNFKCTPTAGFTLTFTNITAGQSGNILLINNSNYAIAAAATTKVGSSTLSTISATGTYWLSYYTDGTNVYVSSTGALA